jgi:predicted ArsR family transcriptional regulator
MRKRERTFSELDDVVHQKARLGILWLLYNKSPRSFTSLRDDLSLTDGNVNRHLRMLNEARLVKAARVKREVGRAATEFALTPKGRTALEEHRSDLARLLSM